jgi:3-hydroxyisobutyrate dehydrogenase-like beta-hydroxyacid dehydrogenase
LTVGLIGLGQIGGPIAENLIACRTQVVGFRRGDTTGFVAIGGIAATSSREVAERSQVIISCLPDDGALQDVVSGPRGLLSARRPGLVLIELSTLSLSVKRQQAEALKAAGSTMLDGAISGIPQMVRDRQGVIFIGAEPEEFDRCRPMLDQVSDKVMHIGAFGDATKMKLVANLLVSVHILAAAEALAFGAKLGLSPDLIATALQDSAATSFQFRARAKRMAAQQWEPVLATTKLLLKDVGLIREAAKEHGCNSGLLDTAAPLFEEVVQLGFGDVDAAAVFEVTAKHAGLHHPATKSKENSLQ